ncbi:hypothetical protein SAMN04488066_10627 [Halorubrum aquaticum]|uniref:Uncharacterized protein n=1 Tax=Halorubrum aquaticum TaxID=387340 RepID=A0A1I3AKW2_9EURY|nr:hypothetical protein [Halorubrum aquaticum]SFH49981.1 hypothetical protein SAMN04488066_10627 [Halorubrum aquaticum]
MTDQDLKNKVVNTLLNKRVTGSNKTSIDTLLNYSVRDSEQGKARDLLKDEMLPNAEASIQQVGGGARENVQLADVKEAVRYLYEHGGDVPWGFREYIEDDWEPPEDE